MSHTAVSSRKLQTPISRLAWFGLLGLLLLFIPTSLFAATNAARFLGGPTLLVSPYNLNAPGDIAVDRYGTTYIASQNGNNIQVVNQDAQGFFQQTAGDYLNYSFNYEALGQNVFTYTISCSNVGGLLHPQAVTVDGSGRLFIADTGNSRVLEVDVDGLYGPSGQFFFNNPQTITCTPINTGTVGLTSPTGVAVDQYGNIYISDGEYYQGGTGQVIEVPSNNNPPFVLVSAISPVSGSATPGVFHPGKIAWSVFLNELLIADAGNNRLLYFNGGLGIWNFDTPNGSGLLNPQGVSVDSVGNVFVADTGDNGNTQYHQRVLEIPQRDQSNSYPVMTTGCSFYYDQCFGGNLVTPVSVQVDAFGSPYVVDQQQNVIYANVGAPTGSSVNFYHVPLNYQGSITAGNNPFNDAYPNIEVLFFQFNSTNTLGAVTAYTQGTEFLDYTIVNEGFDTCFAGQTFSNGDVCTVTVQFDATAPGLRRGAVVLYDTSGDQIAEAPLFGTATAPQIEFFPAGYGAPVSTGSVPTVQPVQIALDGDNNLFVANYSGNNVVEVPPQGGTGIVVPWNPNSDNQSTNQISGVALDGAGNIYVADHINSTIWVINPDDAWYATPLNINFTGGYKLNEPMALAFDPAGNLFIADWGNSYVAEVTGIAGDTYNGFYGVGNLVNTGNWELGCNGNFCERSVTGVAVDPLENILIADSYNNTILVAPQTMAGISPGYINGNSGNLNWPYTFYRWQYDINSYYDLRNPQGVASDGFGNWYVVDSGNSRILALSPKYGEGLVVTSINPASPGPLGNNLFGVSVDPWGNVFVPDYANNRIAEYSPKVPPALTFADTYVGAITPYTQPIDVVNTGNTWLLFSDPPNTTNNFGEDDSSNNSCYAVLNDFEGALPGGAGCQQYPTFAPTVDGLLTGTTTFLDDNLYPAGWSHLNPTFYQTPQSLSLTGKGLLDTPVSVIVHGSPNSVFLKNPVAYTATVTGNVTLDGSLVVPTGTVTFTDGTHLLGTAPVVSGVASITATPYEYAGTHNITATYSGDEVYSTAASDPYAEVVQDFVIAVPNPASAAIYPGATASFVLSFSPTNGATFPAAISLAVTGAPAGSTVTLSPTSIAAGGPANVTLTVTAPAITNVAANQNNSGLGSKLAPISFALLLLPLFGFRKARKTWQRYLAVVILLIGGLAATSALSGCSTTPSGYFGQGGTTYDYKVTVTGTSGGLTHSTYVELTVN